MAADYAGRTDWINALSPQHVAELDAAVAGIEQRGISEIHVSAACCRLLQPAACSLAAWSCCWRGGACGPRMRRT